VSSETIDRGGAWHPLIEMSRARMMEFIREPEALFWTFAFPIIMAVVLAVAFPGSGARRAIVGVGNGDGAAAMRELLSKTPGIGVRDIPAGGEARALREGDIHLLVVPGVPPAYRYDPNREESRAARLLVDDALKRAAGRSDPWTAREEPVEVAGSRYVDWLIPGLIGMNLMGGGMWGMGFGIVQTRMRKVLKRLAASPMRHHEYLLAQFAWRIVFLAPEVGVPLAFGALVLGMPIRGSIVSITLVSLLGALAFGSIGLLVASRVRTFEAVSGLLNATMVPMWLAGGVFFSAANFPPAVQPIVQLIPLTALNNALRSVILEGAPLLSSARDLGCLAVWGTVSFGIALKIFRWR
jgi:ABC-type multidrug transport system permease subunit